MSRESGSEESGSGESGSGESGSGESGSGESGSGGPVPSASDVVEAADVRVAQDRLEAVAHDTPLDESTTIARRCGADRVDLKLENMQRTGSFKIRGAYNAMARLSPDRREAGVVASSAGNHAQGVALAGDLLDVDTTIVVPETTPTAKIEATRGYGAEVVVEGAEYEDSYEYALELADEAGLTFVHPFDDADVIAGQGTVGLEILREAPDVDTVLVPVGGGGLVSGVATALDAHDSDVRVVGVQPEGAAHAKPSLEADEIRVLPAVDTVAEGIADARLLAKTFAVVRERVDDVVSVSDTDLAVATALLAERAKTVAEAAGAAPVAALLSGAVSVEGERVAAVVSGGNVNLTEHAELTRVGLQALDRYVEARLELDRWPAVLGVLGDAVASHGAELDVAERTSRTAADTPNRVPVRVGLEGSGPDHLRAVLRSLADLDDVTVAEHTLDDPP